VTVENYSFFKSIVTLHCAAGNDIRARERVVPFAGIKIAVPSLPVGQMRRLAESSHVQD
jgi:hypothetical protein